MLPSSRRIPKDLYNIRGKLFSYPFFTLKIVSTQKAEQSRFSVSVSKKVAPGAVERNLIRRRLYSTLRIFLPHTPTGFLVFFQTKKGIEKLKPTVLEEEVKKALLSAGTLNFDLKS